MTSHNTLDCLYIIPGYDWLTDGGLIKTAAILMNLNANLVNEDV